LIQREKPKLKTMNNSFIIVLLALAASISNSLIAQPAESFVSGSSSNTIFRLHLVSLGIGIEQAMTPKVSLLFDLSYGGDYNENFATNEIQWVPYLSVEPRYFYNLDKRAEKGKRIDYFSGQFVSFQTRFGFPVGDVTTWYSFAPMWGFQRSLGKIGYWSIQLGPGLQGSAGRVYPDFNGDFKIGFIL
jgi:hypothetical protein